MRPCRQCGSVYMQGGAHRCNACITRDRRERQAIMRRSRMYIVPDADLRPAWSYSANHRLTKSVDVPTSLQRQALAHCNAVGITLREWVSGLIMEACGYRVERARMTGDER